MKKARKKPCKHKYKHAPQVCSICGKMKEHRQGSKCKLGGYHEYVFDGGPLWCGKCATIQQGS